MQTKLDNNIWINNNKCYLNLTSHGRDPKHKTTREREREEKNISNTEPHKIYV